ncbi:hypothetical protein MASR1M31_12740 [Porphyromonadaceae bacterium]
MAEAEIEYRKALEVNQRSVPAIQPRQFNDEATNMIKLLINTKYCTNTQDKRLKRAFHNIGNIAMEAQQRQSGQYINNRSDLIHRRRNSL